MSGGTSVVRLRPGASDDWLTPPWVFDALRVDFWVDPCVPESGAPKWSRAYRHYRPSEDGLSQSWEGGPVWLNPPYSNPGPWMERMAEVNNGIALVFARTETAWFQDHVWPNVGGALFLRGRVSFVSAEERDGPGHNAPAPSVLLSYGDRMTEVLKGCGIPGAFVGVHR